MKYGQASTWEWLHRTSLIPAYIRRSYDSSLRRSRLACDLDRSELSALSYSIGQAMTAIFCMQKLNVSHMLHVDRYARVGRLQFGTTTKRPDLFGLSPNGWIVAEAKGRTRAADNQTIKKIGEQKRAVSTICGQPPYLTVGCISSFPAPLDALKLDVVDPTDEPLEPIQLAVDLDRFILAYYSPLLDLIDAGRAVELSDGYLSRRFADLGIEIRLRSDIYRLVRDAQSGRESGLHENVQETLSRPTRLETDSAPMREDASFGRSHADGSIFITDWAEEIRATAIELEEY
ncbi:MAG: hypothetical protein AB7I38_19740 [Dehalococcoidia bacterium]